MKTTRSTSHNGDDVSLLDRIKRRFLLGLGFGIAVVIAITAFADGPALARTLGDFRWWLVPFILALTLVNYALRFLKWQLYLRWLDIDRIPLRTSLGIFLAGMSMAITPGKVGELLKSYLLRRANGTPVSVSAPIIVAERVTDGIAMLGLASVGLFSVRYGWPVLAALSLIALAGIVMLQRRELMFGIFDRLERVPLVSRRMHTLHALYESTYLLFRPGNLLGATGVGLISWAGECFAFFLILIGLGFDPTLHLLVLATFILATATLLGSISMLPGGLGAAEASVAGLLIVLVRDGSMTQDLAAAATLLVRFATLWFGVLIGLVALLVIEKHLNGLHADSPPMDVAQVAD